MLYPQNGGRIVTIDSVSLLHHMYTILYIGWSDVLTVIYGHDTIAMLWVNMT